MTSTGSPEELARLAVDSLQHVRIDPQAAGNMSRRRFICLQANSTLLAILTCLTICIVTLLRVEKFSDFFLGKCSLPAQIYKMYNNLTTSNNCTPPTLT